MSSLSQMIERCKSKCGISADFTGGEILAKVLAQNDDSGRHGVLIPIEAYEFFPRLVIDDPDENATTFFNARDLGNGEETELAWKYYQRYPERRITRLDKRLNNRVEGQRRLVVFLRFDGDDVAPRFAFLAACEADDPIGFSSTLTAVFGEAPKTTGSFIRLPIEAPSFIKDETLTELLRRFDAISNAWIPSKREGPTGVGYTLEQLIGVEENNSGDADFFGIELKCKANKKGSPQGKINLFQQAPQWADTSLSGLGRLKIIGKQDASTGRYQCYSEVKVSENNLGLSLVLRPSDSLIDLVKSPEVCIGYWPWATLESRLIQKHSRLAFIKADVRSPKKSQEFNYFEFTYCEKPSIASFIRLVEDGRIVFEFTMSEKERGIVRNHGYPWRLGGTDYLSQLFASQVRLRGPEL